MVLLLVFMLLTRDLFAIAKFLLIITLTFLGRFLSRVILTHDIDRAILSVCLSVCLSVRLSVTRWYCMKTD